MPPATIFPALGARPEPGRSVLPALLALVPFLLAGCATPPPPPPPATDPLVSELNQMISKAAALPLHTASADAIAPAMKVVDGRVWVSWRGSAHDLLVLLAPQAGFRLDPLSGPQPRLPIYVQVNSKGSTVDELLRDIGYQLGQRADLVLRPGSVEMRYRSY